MVIVAVYFRERIDEEDLTIMINDAWNMFTKANKE